MALIKYKDAPHEYFHGRKKMLSVGKFLNIFGFDYDEPLWLLHGALKENVPNFHKKFFTKFNYDEAMPSRDQLYDHYSKEIKGFDLEKEIKKISDDWDLSRELGTKFHDEREQEALESGVLYNPYVMKEFEVKDKPKPPKGYDNVAYGTDLSSLEDGAYTEILIHSVEHGVCGTSDEAFIETIDGIRYVDIGDHKTNKTVPRLRGKETLLPPVDHLIDCQFVKYQSQVSLYAYLLSLHGFTPRYVGFYHYKDYDVSTKSVKMVKYLGKECKLMLDYYRDFA